MSAFAAYPVSASRLSLRQAARARPTSSVAVCCWRSWSPRVRAVSSAISRRVSSRRRVESSSRVRRSSASAVTRSPTWAASHRPAARSTPALTVAIAAPAPAAPGAEAAPGPAAPPPWPIAPLGRYSERIVPPGTSGWMSFSPRGSVMAVSAFTRAVVTSAADDRWASSLWRGFPSPEVSTLGRGPSRRRCRPPCPRWAVGAGTRPASR